ncbi:MAG: hypothetical protein WC783_00910, partial [Candidatus Paceibacterota bacterium]
MKRKAVFFNDDLTADYSYNRTLLKKGMLVKRRIQDGMFPTHVIGMIDDISLTNRKATVIWDTGKITQEDVAYIVPVTSQDLSDDKVYVKAKNLQNQMVVAKLIESEKKTEPFKSKFIDGTDATDYQKELHEK